MNVFVESSDKTNIVQEEKTEKLELTCIEITQHMIRSGVSLQYIKVSIDDIKKIIPAILCRLNTIETYYKDKA
ncbi:Uncharacterized protein FWK35_00035545 [Aphis craccivora]|uniref:Uncharacterized protein n=1 Tax=Aphis craccivora TaxID=307492 RepID=A0A6G0VLY7_APHCR|nr:Uncharacterized protein FWK35_00035545 [Aphis craccivora]